MNKEPVKKAKKGILSIVFSRISLLAVLLIIQIALIVGTVTYLEDYATDIYVIFIVLEVISVVYIINSKSNPAFKTIVYPFNSDCGDSVLSVYENTAWNELFGS